ncbi:MAG: L-seryl-tRNA(Sec) selenium transferase [Dehalococcoidia bacterium]
MRANWRSLPSVDRLVSDPKLKSLGDSSLRPLLLNLARQYLEELRQGIGRGEPCPLFDQIVEAISLRAQLLSSVSLQPVINASGVLLHTNLGRAPLSQEALQAMEAVARGYSNLEIDLESGKRGSRYGHIESLLCQLTGAEAGMVVNNNASALLLALTALARRKEVIISRGQAVEIGGGVRIPEVLRQSGARLVEVGTTNRTYARDYEAAITPRTAALLRVHSSNFKVIGFTCAVPLREMVELTHRHSLLLLDDLGSGCLLDTAQFGLDHEPMIQESIALGADLVFSSGDKLMGGPQAGIIVGQQALVERLKRHPLARAVRIDKISLAGLAATLIHYLKGEALSRLPVWQMLSPSLEELESRSQTWAGVLPGWAEVVDGESVVGGGSLPGNTLPTRLVAIKGRGKQAKIAQTLAEALRRGKPPVLARVDRDTLFLDPRTVLSEEDEALLLALRRVGQKQGLL